MNAQALAQMMNVTENDINSLLRMVTDSMLHDGMREHFLSMDEAERVETMNAYIQAEVKKFSEFCITLLTNQEKKSAFDQYLFSQLKD